MGQCCPRCFGGHTKAYEAMDGGSNGSAGPRAQDGNGVGEARELLGSDSSSLQLAPANIRYAPRNGTPSSPEATSTAVATAPKPTQVFTDTRDLLVQGAILTKHGAMIKRNVHFRLGADCSSFEYTTDFAGGVAQGGTKTLAVASVMSVQACPADGDCTFGVQTDERVHKFDASSASQMRLWVKAVWDAVALLQYADEQLPLLLQGTLMQKHGMLIKRQVRLRLTPDMHSLEYADFDAEAGGFGARKCIALDALREVLDGGGATLGLDVAGDRVHKFDAGNGAAEKSQWLDALRGCLTNAKFHPLLQRRNMASETRVGGGVGQACADAVAMGGGGGSGGSVARTSASPAVGDRVGGGFGVASPGSAGGASPSPQGTGAVAGAQSTGSSLDDIRKKYQSRFQARGIRSPRRGLSDM